MNNTNVTEYRREIYGRHFVNMMLLTLLPGMAIIPGRVEARFSLPFDMYIIGTVVFNTDYSKLKNTIKENRIKCLVLYGIGMVLVICIFTSTLAAYTEAYQIFME